MGNTSSSGESRHIERRKDYEMDRGAAREYLEHNERRFLLRLDHREIRICDRLKIEDYRYLREINSFFEGKRYDTRGEIYTNNERLEMFNKSSEIDDIFERKVTKTKDSQYIYINFKLEDFNYRNDYLSEGQLLNVEKINEFKEKFQEINYNGYIIGNLTKNQLKDEEIIQLRLKIPKGNKVIYSLGNDYNANVIVEKDKSIAITNFTPINFYGKNILKLDGKLISKEKIYDNISKKQYQLNKKLKKELGINNAVITDVKSVRTLEILKRAEDIIDNYIKMIPKKVLIGTFNYEPNPSIGKLKIEFTNETIIAVDRTGRQIDVIGRHLENLNKIRFDITHKDIMEGIGPQYNYIQVSMHELAHAIDTNILNGFASKPEFEGYFDLEKNNLTPETSWSGRSNEPYGKTNSEEFFAEVFAAMYSPDSQLRNRIRQQVPSTCIFIEQKMNQVKM